MRIKLRSLKKLAKEKEKGNDLFWSFNEIRDIFAISIFTNANKRCILILEEVKLEEI
jgi:hypothetical protein